MIANRAITAEKGVIKYSIDLNGTDENLTLATPPVGTSRRIFTLSVWVKPTNTSWAVFGTNNGNHYSRILTSTGANIPEGVEFNNPTTHWREVCGSNQLDTGAWKHLVLRVDTTAGTAADRVKFYVNGVECTPTSTTNPSLNYDTLWGNQYPIQIGSGAATAFMAGKLAYAIYVDGQALLPSSFGQTVGASWKPKRYTGTYGLAGFRLLFENGSNLGTDTSGNGNHFTANNLDASDRSGDVP